jgi:glycosyltransferase involved in cell wall biosynthesis
MNGRKRVTAFLVQRIGPYHHARLQALAADRDLAVHAVEFRPGDEVYAWDPVETSADYQRHILSSPGQIAEVLGSLRPDVAVCVGYSDPEIHRAAAWAMGRRVPLVTCCDSTYADEPRTAFKEALKCLVISAFDSALVAGSRAHDYLATLGMKGGSRFRPWDVVDNGHFERGADAARRRAPEIRLKMGLPDRYFLCVARFVAKKNLGPLVDAYAAYAARAGEAAWSLVLSGAGPLEESLRSRVRAAALGDRVCFPGFVQYGDLPSIYGLAGAFVLPSVSEQWGLVVNEAMASGLPVLVSSRCGCAPDLVRTGENGFVLDSEDNPSITQALARMAGLAPAERSAMGRRSREVIAAYTPAEFASGLRSAIECAVAQKPRPGRVAVRLVMGALAARRLR